MANQFISEVGLAPVRAGCGLSKPRQSSCLTVFFRCRQSTCPGSGMAAELHHTKEESVAPRQGERVQRGKSMRGEKERGREGERERRAGVTRRRPGHVNTAALCKRHVCTSSALDAARFVGCSFPNELAAEGMARERRYDDARQHASTPVRQQPPQWQPARAGTGSTRSGRARVGAVSAALHVKGAPFSGSTLPR